MSTIRKQSLSSSDSIKSIDSKAYSTDKSRSDSDKQRTNSRNSDVDESLIIDLSANLILKEGWGIPLQKQDSKKKQKRRSRDITYKPRKTPTPTINFDYDQFINIDIEEFK